MEERGKYSENMGHATFGRFRVWKDTKRDFENDNINKGSNKRELFYHYANNKTKSNDHIIAIKREKTAKLLSEKKKYCEILNDKFQLCLNQKGISLPSERTG